MSRAALRAVAFALVAAAPTAVGGEAVAAVDAPPALSLAATTLGLDGATCVTFAVPRPQLVIDTWYGSGSNGTWRVAEHNGKPVDPRAFAAHLRESAAEGDETSSAIEAGRRACGGRFDACQDTAGAPPFATRRVFCFVCCTDGEPFAACDADHFTAICKCL